MRADVNIRCSIGRDATWQIANIGDLAARFWAKVRRGAPSECWLWTASTLGSSLPYGQFCLPRPLARGKQVHVYAHRVAWMLTYGAIPEGMNVCHRCDVAGCVNPNHLFLGSQADNLADCRAKGRMPSRKRA